MVNKVINIEDKKQEDMIYDGDTDTDNTNNSTDIKQDNNDIGEEERQEQINDIPSTDENKPELTIENRINDLPENFPAARSIMEDDIIPLILNKDSMEREHYINLLKMKFKISKQVIRDFIQIGRASCRERV